MWCRVLVAPVCLAVLWVAMPAAVAGPSRSVSRTSDRTTGRAAVAVKRVVRRYGDGPVAVRKDQRLVLRFKGSCGDRVRLAKVRPNPVTAYLRVDADRVRVHGPHGRLPPDAAGFFQLPEHGWFRIVYVADSHGRAERLQLVKQRRVTHRARHATRLGRRRGYQYAVRVAAPRRGIQIVAFGDRPDGIVSRGRYRGYVDGQALVVASGLPVYTGAGIPTIPMTRVLKGGQSFVVLVDPARSARVVTTRPARVGRMALDGGSVNLPAGGKRAVVADLEASDLAASAQGLLNVRVAGKNAMHEWGVLVLRGRGGGAQPTAPVRHPDSVPLFHLAPTAGTYRVLAFPGTRWTRVATLELDSVADGGTVAIDGPTVTVPARADGRSSLLAIAQPGPFPQAYLSVSEVTVPSPWTVYAARLTAPHCGPGSGLGCDDSNGVEVTSSHASNQSFSFGGYVLTMPHRGQATGSWTVRLSTTDPY